MIIEEQWLFGQMEKTISGLTGTREMEKGSLFVRSWCNRLNRGGEVSEAGLKCSGVTVIVKQRQNTVFSVALVSVINLCTGLTL